MPAKKQSPEPTPIVTFYSYKGGVGRSMAVLNVASLIASRGFRVLIIDFDLEAPGLSHLIGKAALPAKNKVSGKSNALFIKDGVVELLSDAVARGPQADLFSKPFSKIADKYTFSYKPPKQLEQHAGANLSIMPAGRQDESYPSRLDSLNLPDLYRAEGNPGKRLILHFREVLRNCGLYDYILIDSRTGHSDEAGICTRDLADHRMVVSGLNTQNISGTATFLRNLRAALTREDKPLKAPDIILSPIPNGEDETVADCEKDARERFKNAWGKALQLDLLIPYHPRLALSEEAYFPTITASPLRSAYLAIETRLLESLGHTKNSLFNAFKKQIQDGLGKLALGTLHHWMKLLRTPGKRNAPKMLHVAYFLIHENGELLKKLLRLPEGLEILKTLAIVTSDGEELLRIARRIHSIDPVIAANFDKFLVELDSFDEGDYGSYALFLAERLGDPDTIEIFYKRAINANPTEAADHSNYANFLTHVRHDHKAAEVFYQRAIELDSDDANYSGNFGQLLIGQRRIDEGLIQLREAWRNCDPTEPMQIAEIAFSLWIGTCLAGAEEAAWERTFKFLIRKGFPRPVWNFDAMLAVAETKLESADFDYAKALAEAFLDESKIPVLENIRRWKQLQPLDPARVKADGTLREG